jgi:hypothetical protein
MKDLSRRFWNWYERNKTFNLGLAAFLFGLQIIHLIWLTGDVVIFRLTGNQIFGLTDHHTTGLKSFFATAILIVDYLEIPAIITTSLVYINELRKKFQTKAVLYLFFLNSQWLHIFWITDEFVVERFSGHATETALPIWLAWIAILIDYLELPVIFDTTKRFLHSLDKKGVRAALTELKES